MGRPGRIGTYKDWIEGPGLENICKWLKLGLSDLQIMKNIGICPHTFYGWIRRFPEFAKRVKEARRIPELEIENAMFDLACGRSWVEEIRTVLDPKNGSILRIEKTRRQIPPNPVMLIFMAKNKMRDRYRDYAPTPVENNTDKAQQNVEIYLPANGRDEK